MIYKFRWLVRHVFWSSLKRIRSLTDYNHFIVDIYPTYVYRNHHCIGVWHATFRRVKDRWTKYKFTNCVVNTHQSIIILVAQCTKWRAQIEVEWFINTNHFIINLASYLTGLFIWSQLSAIYKSTGLYTLCVFFTIAQIIQLHFNKIHVNLKCLTK